MDERLEGFEGSGVYLVHFVVMLVVVVKMWGCVVRLG